MLCQSACATSTRSAIGSASSCSTSSVVPMLSGYGVSCRWSISVTELLQLSSQRFGDFAAEFHGVDELRDVERLEAVAHGVLGIGMYFQEQAIGAGGDAGARHLWHEVRV